MDGCRKLSYPIRTFIAMDDGVALVERLAGLPVGVELVTLAAYGVGTGTSPTTS